MPVANAVAQQEISQQQSLTLMRNMMRLWLRVGDATPSRSYPPSDAASVAKFTPARSERGAAASPPPSRHAPSVRSPLAPLSRGIQKKRASQASEPIHTVFQEKKAQQKRPTRAAGRR